MTRTQQYTLWIVFAGGVCAWLLYKFFERVAVQASTEALQERDRNLAAFLMMIRRCEGTAGPDGYRTMFTHKLFTDFSRHPNIVNEANGYRSTAAGAYQFLYKTWQGCARALDLKDFTPESQDRAAAFLIAQRGALEDVRAGRIADAIHKCRKEWASLPNSPYGQPTKSLTVALGYYTNAGGYIA